MPTSRFKDYVIDDLLAWRRAGERGALVTLIGVDGSAPRPLGAQMAVRENGDFVGHLTGGCAEAAIVAEALAAMEEGANRRLRYGAGSPYLDIQLPCGSGIDVYVDAATPTDVIAEIASARGRRRPISLTIDSDAHRSELISWPAASAADELFIRDYAPRTRLFAIGAGPILGALSELAAVMDFEMVAFSPDESALDLAQRAGAETRRLTTPDAFEAPPGDRWTAATLLFHDHDWETPLLTRLLSQPLFYLAALGSRRTHAQRVAALIEAGCDAASVGRIKGPAGLDIGAKSPSEIALSIMAEIVAAQRSEGGLRGQG
ncbi:MAG: XdhC family protein [Pseudomonadota bacterium]